MQNPIATIAQYLVGGGVGVWFLASDSAPQDWWSSKETMLAAAVVVLSGVIAKGAVWILNFMIQRMTTEGDGYRKVVANYEKIAAENTDAIKEMRLTNEKLSGHLAADIESRGGCLHSRMLLSQLRATKRITDAEIADITTNTEARK